MAGYVVTSFQTSFSLFPLLFIGPSAWLSCLLYIVLIVAHYGALVHCRSTKSEIRDLFSVMVIMTIIMSNHCFLRAGVVSQCVLVSFISMALILCRYSYCRAGIMVHFIGTLVGLACFVMCLTLIK